MFKFNRDYSAYPEHAGEELEWLPADTLKAYKLSCKNIRLRYRLEKEGWIDHKFTYKFNSHGFRSDEFIEEVNNSILFLGCSHTVGIGLPYEHTFAYIVAQELGLRNYNLGVGAGSNDGAFRFGSYWIPKLKPKAVVLVSPDESRSEIMLKDGAKQLGAHWSGKKLEEYSRVIFSNNLNLSLNKKKNILALTEICNGLSVPFILIESNEFNQVDKARDLMHAGIGSNKAFAQRILPKVKLAIKENSN